MHFKLITALLASSAMTALAAPAAEAQPEVAVEARAEQWGGLDFDGGWDKKVKARAEQWGDGFDFDELDWDKKAKRAEQDWDDGWDKVKRAEQDWDDEWEWDDKKVKRAEQANQWLGPQGLTFAGPGPRGRWGPGGRRFNRQFFRPNAQFFNPNAQFFQPNRCWGGRCW